MQTYRFIILLLCASLPVLSHAQGFRTRLHQLEQPARSYDDVYAEIEFGRKVAAYVLGREELVTNATLIRYVNLVGKALALSGSRPELEYRFAILHSDAINAYSTPGGYVFITTGALKLAEDESELAAVLAHEIAHIDARHIVKELNIHGVGDDGLSAIARVVGASSDTTRVAAQQAIDNAMALLFDKGYKISDEIEADQSAMLMLAASGYDPLALPRYLKRADDYLAVNPREKSPTHPSSQQRFAQLNQLITEEKFTANEQARLKTRFSHYVSME